MTVDSGSKMIAHSTYIDDMIKHHNADINKAIYGDSEYNIMVEYIARYGDVKSLDTLVKAGANLNHHNNRQQDALYFARTYNNDEMVRYLISDEATRAKMVAELDAVNSAAHHPADLNLAGGPALAVHHQDEI